jgi:hypothetical protein
VGFRRANASFDQQGRVSHDCVGVSGERVRGLRKGGLGRPSLRSFVSGAQKVRMRF